VVEMQRDVKMFFQKISGRITHKNNKRSISKSEEGSPHLLTPRFFNHRMISGE